MAARVERFLVLLALIYNELFKRKVLEALAPDLQGDAIPNQVLAHEAALQEKRGAKSEEHSQVETAASVFAGTRKFLKRLRHAILSAYGDDDVRIAAFEPLGTTSNPDENLARLQGLAKKLPAAVASGEVALVADLQPEKLLVHAAKHASLKTGKAEATKTRQTEGGDLETERAKTRVMVERLKNFVKSYWSPDELTAFGFDLPVPAVRPRLQGVARDSAGAETAKK